MSFSMCNANIEVSRKLYAKGFNTNFLKYALGKLFCVHSSIFWSHQYYEYKSMSDDTNITDIAMH